MDFWHWMNHTLIGWIFRKVCAILFTLSLALVRITYSLIKLVGRGKWLPRGTIKWIPGKSNTVQKVVMEDLQ